MTRPRTVHHAPLEQLVDEGLAVVPLDAEQRQRARVAIVARIRSSSAAQRVTGHLGPLPICRLIRFHGVRGDEQAATLEAAYVLAGGASQIAAELHLDVDDRTDTDRRE